MPRSVDRIEKSEVISRAALRVFRKLGYQNSRMADIAEAAGVGKGTVYEYFKNKDDILRFAFDKYFDSFKAGAIGPMEKAIGPVAKLLALVEFALAHTAEWEDHCAVYVDYWGVGRATKEKGPISLSRIYDEMRGILRQLVVEGQAEKEIREDLDPDATALFLLSAFDGIVLHRIIEGGKCETVSVHRTAVDLLSRGLLSGVSASGEPRGGSRSGHRAGIQG